MNSQASQPKPGFRMNQWRMLLAAMFCYLFFYTGRQTFGFAIPGMQEEFGVSKEALGWVGGIAFWCYAVGQFINGNLADKFGGRRMMSLGAILSCAMNWAVSFSCGLKTLMFSWGLNKYFQAMGWAPGGRILSNWWGHEERGKVFGLYVFAAGLASTLAFVTSLIVVDTLGMDWRWIFRLPVLLMLVGGITFYCVARERPEDMGYQSPHDGEEDAAAEAASATGGTAPGAEPVLERYLAVLGNWRIAVTGATIFFQNAARYGLIVWVPVHFLGPDYKSAEDAMINPRWISIALPVGMAFGALSNGVISDYIFKSKRYLAISLYLLLAAAMSFIMLKIPSEQYKTGLCVLFLCGFFVYGPAASIWALCPDLVGPRRSGTATGVVNFCSYLGVGLAEPFIGRVIDDLEKFNVDPSSLGDSPWASAIGSVASFLPSQQPTAVVFAIVFVLCLLGAVMVLPIRR